MTASREGQQVDTLPSQVYVKDSNGIIVALQLNASGELIVTAPTDGATETTLTALLTELQLKADLSETQPVSAATLPLPTGASTSALQTTGNTGLTNLLTELQLKADLTETQPAAEQNIGLGGTSLTATTDLPTLNTRVQIPAIVPTVAYQLEICFVGAGAFYVTTTDTGTAGTDGLKFEAGEKYYKVLGGSKAVWVASNFSGDDVKVETTEVI